MGTRDRRHVPISPNCGVAFSGSKGWVERYGTQEVSQFRGAEMIADKWDISREDMERFALQSHERALRAIDEGRFDGEIEPVGDVTTDEGPRRGTRLEKMPSGTPAAASITRTRSTVRH